MSIIDDLLEAVEREAGEALDAPVLEVRVGAFWTAVVVTTANGPRCGLASALPDEAHRYLGRHPVRDAGRLHERRAGELIALARSESTLEASIGLATINALLPVDESACVERNAEEVILERGTDRQVVIVGHFPFVPRVQQAARQLWVLELHPREDDLPAERASEVIPRADVVAITGTTLLNKTFEELIRLCREDAFVLVLGPTTPLSPVLFEYGADVISGTVVDDVKAVLRAVSQGATFRQIPGKRLLTMSKEAETGTGE